jgi:SulP family sulfate permease
MLKTRHNSRRELIGQGIANIISSSFNGVGVAGNVACTVANINNGGRTKLSALAHSLVLLLALLLLRPAVQYIPAAAIAGVLTVTGFRLFDTRSLTLFKSKVSRLDFLIVAIVTATTIVSGLVAAVSVGVLITLIIFVRGLVARSIIKRKYYGNAKRSKKVRTSKERELLQRHGGQIVVYELEGALFFGTSDQLLNEMTLDLETKHVIILDFKRVYSMDITATQLIRQIADRVKDKNSRLLLSYVDAKFDRGDVWKQLQEADVLDDIGLEKIFPDTDLALEWAEDALIQRLSVPSSKPAPSEAEGLGARLSPQEEKGTSLKEIVLFEDFSDDELKQIEPFIKFCAYKAGDVIFKEGDEGDTMYLIAAGNVSIRLQIEGESRTKRLTSFGAGAFFGEMALLEGRPRSATATAETDAQLIALTNADFIRFREQHTDLAAKLLLSMVKEISARLRITSEEVRVLEE